MEEKTMHTYPPPNSDKEDDWKKLLNPFKVIRDAVHGDIWVTELETKVMDEEVFQRLRYLRQLGPTYLVYPSTHHTRFEHCLGTLFMADQIINAVIRNYENRHLILGTYLNGKVSAFSLDNRDIVLTRLAIFYILRFQKLIAKSVNLNKALLRNIHLNILSLNQLLPLPNLPL